MKMKGFLTNFTNQKDNLIFSEPNLKQINMKTKKKLVISRTDTREKSTTSCLKTKVCNQGLMIKEIVIWSSSWGEILMKLKEEHKIMSKKQIKWGVKEIKSNLRKMNNSCKTSVIKKSWKTNVEMLNLNTIASTSNQKV